MLGYLLFIAIAVIAAGHIYKHFTGALPEWKYFKPFSASWWVGLIPGVVGLVILGEPVMGWTELADAARLAANDTDATQLVVYSAGAIGLIDRIKSR